MISLSASRDARLIERRLPMLTRLRRTLRRPLELLRDLAGQLVAVVGRAVVDADDLELVRRVVESRRLWSVSLIAAPSLNIGMTTVTSARSRRGSRPTSCRGWNHEFSPKRRRRELVVRRDRAAAAGHPPRNPLLDRRTRTSRQPDQLQLWRSRSRGRPARCTSIAPYWQRAGFYLLPMRMGGGVRFKALEAMARGLPRSSTPLGACRARGPSRDRDYLLAETTAEFRRPRPVALSGSGCAWHAQQARQSGGGAGLGRIAPRYLAFLRRLAASRGREAASLMRLVCCSPCSRLAQSTGGYRYRTELTRSAVEPGDPAPAHRCFVQRFRAAA